MGSIALEFAFRLVSMLTVVQGVARHQDAGLESYIDHAITAIAR